MLNLLSLTKCKAAMFDILFSKTFILGKYLMYNSYAYGYNAGYLETPLVNHTEGAYCFLTRYKVVGNATIFMMIYGAGPDSEVWRDNSAHDGTWRLLRVDIDNIPDRVDTFQVSIIQIYSIHCTLEEKNLFLWRAI
jgi:hypothetical protein